MSDEIKESKPDLGISVQPDIEGQIAQQVSSVVKDRNERERLTKKIVTIVQTRISSSPTPPPEFCHVYEQYAPGSTQKLIDHAIKEAEHRRELEKTHLNAEKDIAFRSLSIQEKINSKEINTERLGILAALIIAFLMIGTAGILFYLGHVAAGTAIIGAIATVITVFIVKRKDSEVVSSKQEQRGHKKR